MRTYLINLSPLADLSPMKALLTGLEDRLTVLEADGVEALGTCARDQAFAPVERAFGSDFKLNIILFCEFKKRDGVVEDNNEILKDILLQEVDYVRNAVDIMKSVCRETTAKLETLTFLFGERCSHGQIANNTRGTEAGIANEIGNLIRKIRATDPARLRELFAIRYAYIDMDQYPTGDEIRSDWYFYFQIMSFACLTAHDVRFPMGQGAKHQRSGPATRASLDGSDFLKAYPLPPLDRANASRVIGQKISALQQTVKKIQKKEYNAPAPEEPDPKDGRNAAEQDGSGVPAQDLSVTSLDAAFITLPSRFSSWKSRKDAVSGAYRKLSEGNDKNLQELDTYRKNLAKSVGGLVRYDVDQYFRRLARQSKALKEQLDAGKEQTESAEQPLRTLRAAALSVGIPAGLYCLTTPFGMIPRIGPIGVVAGFLLAGTCIFGLAANARRLPDPNAGKDAFMAIWERAESDMKGIVAGGQGDRTDMAAKQIGDLDSRAGWHRTRIKRLIDSLEQIAKNVRLDCHPEDETGSCPAFDIEKGMVANRAVYGFDKDDFMKLFASEGEAE